MTFYKPKISILYSPMFPKNFHSSYYNHQAGLGTLVPCRIATHFIIFITLKPVSIIDRIRPVTILLEKPRVLTRGESAQNQSPAVGIDPGSIN
jgi:hypothetical protein